MIWLKKMGSSSALAKRLCRMPDFSWIATSSGVSISMSISFAKLVRFFFHLGWICSRAIRFEKRRFLVISSITEEISMTPLWKVTWNKLQDEVVLLNLTPASLRTVAEGITFMGAVVVNLILGTFLLIENLSESLFFNLTLGTHLLIYESFTVQG